MMPRFVTHDTRRIQQRACGEVNLNVTTASAIRSAPRADSPTDSQGESNQSGATGWAAEAGISSPAIPVTEQCIATYCLLLEARSTAYKQALALRKNLVSITDGGSSFSSSTHAAVMEGSLVSLRGGNGDANGALSAFRDEWDPFMQRFGQWLSRHRMLAEVAALRDTLHAKQTTFDAMLIPSCVFVWFDQIQVRRLAALRAAAEFREQQLRKALMDAIRSPALGSTGGSSVPIGGMSLPAQEGSFHEGVDGSVFDVPTPGISPSTTPETSVNGPQVLIAATGASDQFAVSDALRRQAAAGEPLVSFVAGRSLISPPNDGSETQASGQGRPRHSNSAGSSLRSVCLRKMSGDVESSKAVIGLAAFEGRTRYADQYAKASSPRELAQLWLVNESGHVPSQEVLTQQLEALRIQLCQLRLFSKSHASYGMD